MNTRLSWLLVVASLAACGGPGTGTTGGGGGSSTGGGAASTGGGGGAATGGGTATGGGSATGGGAATGGGTASMSFEPLRTNATWTYDTSDPLNDGGVRLGAKTVTVEAEEAVPGKTGVTAWRLRTVVPGSQVQLTWQQEQATALIRHRDDVYAADGTTLQTFSLYAPSKLRLKTGAADLVTNATYTETFDEAATTAGGTQTTPHTVSWVVLNAAESVTVPAGTFTCVHVQKQSGATPDKDYWFARGVGKVKETATGTGRVEVLRAYAIP